MKFGPRRPPPLANKDHSTPKKLNFSDMWVRSNGRLSDMCELRRSLVVGMGSCILTRPGSSLRTRILVLCTQSVLLKLQHFGFLPLKAKHFFPPHPSARARTVCLSDHGTQTKIQYKRNGVCSLQQCPKLFFVDVLY